MRGLNLLDLVVAVIDVQVAPTYGEHTKGEDGGQRVDGATTPSMLPALRLLAFFSQFGLKVSAGLRFVVGWQGFEITLSGGPIPFTSGFRPFRGTRIAADIGPSLGPGQGQAPGPVHRQGPHLPSGRLRGFSGRRPARAVPPDRVRGLGRGDP